MSLDHIQHFAPKNEELLATLNQTDYAEASLKQQQLYVNDLKKELDDLQSQIIKCERKTKIEKEEFEKYRDSTMKRFAFKIGGKTEKFNSRTEKEEREYYEALEQERAAKDRQASLNTALDEAKNVMESYKRDNDTHVATQKELDSLHNMVFGGPTPGYPQEDQYEWQFTKARDAFNEVEQQHRAMSQALEIFAQSRQHINQAIIHMGEARDASEFDMFGGGAWADMAERNALSRAQSEVLQVQNLISQAQRLHPVAMPQINIAHGGMGDVFFDNIFSDMAFHRKIKDSQMQVLQAQMGIEQQCKQLDQDVQGHKVELDAAQEKLNQARRQLQDTRIEIFKQAGGPPAYQY